MTLYFETPVVFPEHGSISVNSVWHSNDPLLAVASFSQERGGFVIIFDELGESLKTVNYPVHRGFQVTTLAWHPTKIILVTGWENGELRIWNGTDKDFTNVVGPHKAPIAFLGFSEKGTRLVSCDSTGSVIGWKVDSRGETNLSFHLDLKESIIHLTFRRTVKSNVEFDVEGLAKAAVNGDEHALDMFSNWRPKTTARKFKIQDRTDNVNFFVATQRGSLHYINTSGSCSKVFTTDGIVILNILFHPTKDSMLIMLEGFTICYFSVDYQGVLNEMARVKLSGRVQTRNIGSQGITWAGNSCVAILTGDLTVRVWDIESNDNYVLPTQMKLYDTQDKYQTVNEIFTCIAYCTLNQTLCGGTNIGRLYFWTKKQNYVNLENPEDAWELNNVNTISGTIKQLAWGSLMLRLPLLSVNCVTSVYIMKEQSICSSFSEKIWAIQKTSTQILIESDIGEYLLELDAQVTNMSISTEILAFTTGRSILVYEILWNNTNIDRAKEPSGDNGTNNFSVRRLTSFDDENESIRVYYKKIISMNAKTVSIFTWSGTFLFTIATGMAEGENIDIDVSSNFLTIFTMEGYLKIYDLSIEKPKLLTPVRTMFEMVPDFGEIIQAKTNSNGTKVAFTLAAANLVPDGKLYVWDIEIDTVAVYDFRKYDFLENHPIDNIDNKEKETRTEHILDDNCKNRIPVGFCWEQNDSRLLICSARKLKMLLPKKGFNARSKSEENKNVTDDDNILVTMFVSPENNIKIHDIKPTDIETKLLACVAPFVVSVQKLSIMRDIMNDFIGLEKCDDVTGKAILDFSYYSSLGDMDSAFKSIKLIESKGVWNSLAKMCVKTKRLDVASVCLGHVGNAGAARALRLADADNTLELEAKVALLAIHLNMLEEAEQLYIQCGRYDLLNKLLRSRNKLDAAHAVAESNDRINLRNTEHTWARMLEQSGDFKEAAARYERANTHLYDVPRMLSDHPQQLQNYMAKTKDKEMLKWWGQYIESQGDMALALKIYSNAGDIYSQVRVLCFMGKETLASELARSNSEDKAALYHMARYYETVGNYEEAVNMFIKATAYCNAVRLCKENNMINELWNLSATVSNKEKIQIAKYFEEQADLEKSAILYHRGGMLHKAIDLAFQTKQYDILHDIASELNVNSDPALVQKCADYFIDNEQYDKAVDLLAIVKKYTDAINLCMKHNVQLTEDLAEKLTPAKDAVDDDTRETVLETLAESLMVQGNYHLATKKFTQAGDKIRAMKALLKSGDTEKIIFFAGVSRQREIYIMAANYLQTVDWQNQPDILKHIITFYSKGKALDLLANFYVACAQVEIDEFQNYEKALGALTEASRCLQKITEPRDPKQIQRAMDIVQQRLVLVKRFVDIRKLFDRGDSQSALTQCQQLLMTGGNDLEVAVRRGDIYSTMIQHLVAIGNFAEAKQCYVELRKLLENSGTTSITYYINKSVLEALANGLGIPVTHLVPKLSKTHVKSENESEDVEEVVEE
ncbi:intraflagellar transport protein 140 homolog [Diorhabda carinulata]|uniref:intraflagellar transport protein 140 homolog n=1 Tax=Diorhabda carinulata TaxID=1163345 RepID=UPI0025A0D6EC|nr:intraflagellar transport protein 140 homolog [Diorhabda carinulata]